MSQSVDELFKCFICLGQVLDARLCPCCSKLCCNSCITRWLHQRSQCPHCRAAMGYSNLVAVKFIDEITATLEQLSSQRRIDSCEAHSAPLNYYCDTCKQVICPDCAMFSAEHKEHKILHLGIVYETHVELIKNEAAGLKLKLSELASEVQGVDGVIANVKKCEEEKRNEISNCLEQMQGRLEAQLKSKLHILLETRSELCEEIEFLENFHNEVLEKQLNQHSKSSLIKKSPELLVMLREIQEDHKSSARISQVSSGFHSEIIPSYDSGELIIKNYSATRETSEVVYSEPLHSCGLTWRLKIYPNGNGSARNNYISVFLEMLKGVQDSSKYEYRLELINHADPNLMVIREFASDFEFGECWGYNKLFKIDLLSEGGYLDASDSLTIKFYVRAPTYYQQCKDQKLYIEHLQTSRNTALAQVDRLKKELRARDSVIASNENPLDLEKSKNHFEGLKLTFQEEGEQESYTGDLSSEGEATPRDEDSSPDQGLREALNWG